MPSGTETTTLPAPLLALMVLLPVVPLPISTDTLPPPVRAVTFRSAAPSGRTRLTLPPPVSAETWVTVRPERSSLRFPPPLWARIEDETVGLTWISHSVAPLQVSQ